MLDPASKSAEKKIKRNNKCLKKYQFACNLYVCSLFCLVKILKVVSIKSGADKKKNLNLELICSQICLIDIAKENTDMVRQKWSATTGEFRKEAPSLYCLVRIS